MDPEVESTQNAPPVESELARLHARMVTGLAADSPLDERSKPYWDKSFGTDEDPLGQLLAESLEEQQGEIFVARTRPDFRGPWKPVKTQARERPKP